MLEIKTFCFGPFCTNTYVVTIHDQMVNEQMVLVIDPACSNEYEQQQLYRYIEKFSILNSQFSIIATHGHLDHLWGAAWVCKQWHTQVLMHEADIPMAQAMQQQYNLFGIRRTAEPFPIEPLTTNPLTTNPFSIIHTPGHTPGSVCLYMEKEKVLFSGDTLFCMGYGRTDLPGGDTGQLFESLERLFTLPPDIRVYAGHGEETTIGAERR